MLATYKRRMRDNNLEILLSPANRRQHRRESWDQAMACAKIYPLKINNFKINLITLQTVVTIISDIKQKQ